jgi:hypothetical protein
MFCLLTPLLRDVQYIDGPVAIVIGVYGGVLMLINGAGARAARSKLPRALKVYIFGCFVSVLFLVWSSTWGWQQMGSVRRRAGEVTDEEVRSLFGFGANAGRSLLVSELRKFYLG